MTSDTIINDGKHCTGCGATFIWGKFAYRQELCLDCFEKKVSAIASNAKTIGDGEIVLHLLRAYKERIGIPLKAEYKEI